jgi:two-component system, response regulator
MKIELPDEVDVLLVDGNPLEVELTLRALTGLAGNLRVGVARDGEEALDYLLSRGGFRHRQGASLPRLILLELKLPRVDGPEVLRAIRSSHRTSTVPIVVLTASTEPRVLAQCYQLGANSCVQKPIEFQPFCTTLQAMARYWLGINQPPPTLVQTV